MSNYHTLTQLTQDVIRQLSMYQGTNTQIYAEDRIADTIIRLFNRILDSRFWNSNIQWFKYELTGIKGVCKETVNNDIAKFTDIANISTEINPQYSLKRLHSTTNPYLVTGNTPCYYIPTTIEDKIFAVVPFECTGTIYVQARVRPAKFTIDTVIPFDPDVLVYGACWEYVADDGNSNTQLQKFQQLYQERLKELEALDNSGTYDYNDEEAYYSLNQWR